MSSETDDRVRRLMNAEPVATAVARDRGFRTRVQNAIGFLIAENEGATDEDVLLTVGRLLKPLRDQRITAFCSYKEKDKEIALQLDEWFREWSAGKLQMKHMATFGIGLPWRKQIRKDIPTSDWFLLLLPGLEAERDWPLFEAGYFRPGRTLSRRFVCLHHPDNEVTDALGDHQSVPADPDKVEQLLEELFHQPNWIPGLPPVNHYLDDLPKKAQDIVDLIKPPPQERECCGPHMQVDFSKSAGLSGWALLASGYVKHANDECKELFDIARHRGVMPRSLREWLRDADGVGRDEGWVAELAEAVRAVGEGRRVKPVASVLALPEGRFVQPKICAVTRRKDGALEAIDLLFLDAPSPRDHSLMSPGFAALATALEFAVEFRAVLENSLGRRPDREEMKAFGSALQTLERKTASDPRFATDPQVARRLTVELFDGDQRAEIDEMYDRWEELRRPDGTGELDRALEQLDSRAFEDLVVELLDLNQRFLKLVSARFTSLVQSPEAAWRPRAPTLVQRPQAVPPAGWSTNLGTLLGPWVDRARRFFSEQGEPAPEAERATDAPARSVDPRSIAVLPFDNLSADPQNPFADGMTEEIISRLSMVDDLRVLSRYAVMDYKRTRKTRPQIVAELGVAYVLEGSVRCEGPKVRITGQLIDARRSTHVWAASYDRELDDVFAVQSAVAESIVSALKVKLSAAESEVLKKGPTDNLTAYGHYLEGMRHYDRYLRERNEQAIEFFNKALEEDPEYALAHAGLARAYYQRAARFGLPKSESLEASLREANRAIELDPELPEALCARGAALSALGLTEEALRAELKAIELKPSFLLAIMNAGVTYSELGRLDDSLRLKKKALELDPLSSNCYSQLGLTYMLLDLDDEAQRRFDRAIELEPDSVQTRAFLARLYLARGDDERALEQAEEILTRFPGEPMGLQAAGRVHWFAGRSSRAETFFRQNLEQSRIALAQIVWKTDRAAASQLLAHARAPLEEALDRGSRASWVYRRLAAIHAVRGEKGQAYEDLERAIETGAVDYRNLQRMPVFAAMRDEERFQQCMEQIRRRVDEMRLRVEAREAA